MWDTIKSNKDLNLPTQREMLATYRCDEVRSPLRMPHFLSFWLCFCVCWSGLLCFGCACVVSLLPSRFGAAPTVTCLSFESSLRELMIRDVLQVSAQAYAAFTTQHQELKGKV